MLSDVILEGDTVRLRPIAEDDLPYFLEWLRDPDVNRWLSLPQGPPNSLEDERRWWEGLKVDPSQIAWSIETKEGVLLGDVVLHTSQVHPEAAQLGIFIGNSAHWSRGHGTDAVRALLSYAFGAARLHRVYLQVDEDNRRAHRCFEKSGFLREGRVREYRRRWSDGRFISGTLMAALATESANRPARV